jgi:hypothetical protein
VLFAVGEMEFRPASLAARASASSQSAPHDLDELGSSENRACDLADVNHDVA